MREPLSFSQPNHMKKNLSKHAFLKYFPWHFILADELPLEAGKISAPEFLLVPLTHCYDKPGTPLQYSCLANPMDGGAWWAAVHGVTKSRTRLSDWTELNWILIMEKTMATHSSTLTWKIPWTGEPGRLQSMGSRRVGHNWAASLSLFFL